MNMLKKILRLREEEEGGKKISKNRIEIFKLFLDLKS